MANPDSTLLSWITAEVNHALSVVREQIARFSANAGDTAVLHGCSDHLHQVSGALRMVGLNGATRFCEAIEASFAGLTTARASPQTMALIDKAVSTLKEFVEGLERGQPNVPLRLFPVYRELGAFQGRPDSAEKDLFFPDMSALAPAHPDPRTLSAEELPAFLHAQRAQFQRGLLGWLRSQPAGLERMTQALDALHQVAEQLPEPRAQWWVAKGLMQLLAAPADPDWLAASKALCNRIDFQMRDLASGSNALNEGLLRELLYAVGRSRSASPLTREIRQLYQLDALFPAAEAAAPSLDLNMEWLEAALYDMHSRLEALKSAWVQYVSGEQKSAARLRELVASFKAKAGELRNQHMIKLLDAIALVAKHLPDPYPRQNQYMVIEMASAFLLVESVIDHFTSPPSDLEEQIVILGGWLLDSAKGRSTSEPPAGLRADLVQKIGALQLRAQVAKEIIANLQHMEQVLDAFARDPGKRDSLEGLGPYGRQIHGALKVLGFERAAEAVAICEHLIGACAALQRKQAAEEMDWIAEGLSSVGFYLAPCLNGREPAEQAIDLFFQRYGRRMQPQPDERADISDRLSAEALQEHSAARAGVDPELLGIFLDEAEEVLQSIQSAVPLCREQANHVEALTRIRRGFHTLKGSGRMVGLMDLGEVAWEIEQLMNVWLEHKRPATDGLLDLVVRAAQAFGEWVEKLREHSLTGEIDAAELISLARSLKSAEEQPTFLDIYTKEAAGHVEVLEREFARWHAAPGSAPSEELMRAAHTLASSSNTAGFFEVAELAGALEHWIPFARQAGRESDAQVLQAAVARLRAMTQAIARGEPAGEAAEETRGVRELAMRLESPAAPVAVIHRPVPPEAVADARDKRALHDDFDEQLLPVFLEEARELLPAIGADLRDWKANPADRHAPHALRRALHTLKGSARMAGAIRLGELTHLMESRIEAAVEVDSLPAEVFAELEEKLDRLSVDLERLATPAAQPRQAEMQEKPQSASAMLRVNADVLDHLINETGEVSIARSRVEAELRSIKHALGELSESVARLRGQLREVEIQADSQLQSRLSVLEERRSDFDPLEFDRYTRLQELTRLMAESLNDVIAVQQGLARNLGETDAALLQQGRTNREVQQELMRMRAMPFSTLNERLHRVVRQSARELHKKALLQITGAEVEVDRSVLERIGAPLEHMLRNALAHGLETAEQRAAAGKAETGRIALTLRQESNEIALILSDDGAGIDTGRLYDKAVERGIVPAGQALSEAERLQLVFASGLSTSDAVTQLAGRGVGMDVVRNEITAIGGRIDIASERGQGSTFTLYLPLTLAVTQAVLVRSGSSVFALSTAMVEQVLRLKADAMMGLYAAKEVEFQGRSYPLHSLQRLLDGAGGNEIQGYNSVLLLRSGIQRVALHVDEMRGNQEIVVKNIGPQLARVAWMAGATVLADGSIVPIINPVVLAQRVRGGTPAFEATTLVPTMARSAERMSSAPVIMVVDDSLTVRKITSRLLEREGYQVITAKDGLDALEQLRETLPAVMLVDIEMPRMDGFDLTRHVRGEPRTRDIPIIIISSRTADKHRSQAAALGVNVFLGKPFQEAELLEHIDEVRAAGATR
jgi:chemosensory pili system protein ChpA (sensor histidine kinase/response regulator)